MATDRMQDIGTDRQLFVDELLVDKTDGVDRILHHPVRQNVAIAPENAWETRALGCAGFAYDQGVFKCWYRCDEDPNEAHKSGGGRWTAYAESEDGVHWTKPKLGIFEHNGSKDNNLIWQGPGANFAPFRDPNPDVPDDERYKGVVRKRDLFALASPDGIHWRLLQEEPILTEGPYDSPNVSFWDHLRGEYVTYVRGIVGSGTPLKRERDISIWKEGVRWIRRSTSKDFRTWTDPESIDIGETPTMDYYSNACIIYDRAPGVYLMFPSRFNVVRIPQSDGEFEPGINDIVFMSSRDGFHFDHSFREGFIRPGLDINNWHNRGVYVEHGILHTAPGEMSIYGMENSKVPTQRIRRYTLRTDGFVSMRAGYSGGEFTTSPFTFSGSSLEMNYSTSAVGTVKVEIQDAQGRPQPGFTLDDCPEMFADEIDGPVTWNGGGDVGRLAGQPVRLRLWLNDADIYAFKFND